MECLQHLLDGSTVPILTAFLLGLLTAVSPCPLATNIAAVGYISKDLENRRRVFLNGLLYTLGRVATYTLLGAVLIAVLRAGASVFAIQKAIGKWGEMLIAPALILIGLFMLFGHRLNLPNFGFSGRGERDGAGWRMGCAVARHSFFSGVLPDERRFLFRNAYSDVGRRNGGYLLPAVFAVATGLPVVIVAWLLAYSVAGLGAFYNRMQAIQKWLSRIVGLLFIAVGIYYGAIYFC